MPETKSGAIGELDDCDTRLCMVENLLATITENLIPKDEGEMPYGKIDTLASLAWQEVSDVRNRIGTLIEEALPEEA